MTRFLRANAGRVLLASCNVRRAVRSRAVPILVGALAVAGPAVSAMAQTAPIGTGTVQFPAELQPAALATSMLDFLKPYIIYGSVVVIGIALVAALIHGIGRKSAHTIHGGR